MSEDFEHTGRIIEDEIRIEAPAEDVYAAWADPNEITGWFLGRMDGEMEPGETVTWLWDEDHPGQRQRVLVADAPHRFVTEMELPEGVSYLEVTIEQEGGHSVLRLVQSGFGEGPEWDDQFEGMLSGWMIALGILKLFVERYRSRPRHEVLVLRDADYDTSALLDLQRTEQGLARWLSRSGAPGEVGEPVRLVLGNGSTLTGTVLRTTACETLWSWDEIEGVVELKAFRGSEWGSKVGVRISSWLDRADEVAELAGWLEDAVAKLASVSVGAV